jgi:hypothetical protein
VAAVQWVVKVSVTEEFFFCELLRRGRSQQRRLRRRRGIEANQGDCALCSAQVLVVGLSLPHIVADAIDGGA